jgi:TolB-like protein/class 3 adenylate cyclase
MAATRRLAAILAADVVAYTRLMSTDEEATHAEFMRLIQDLATPRIKEDNGRIVKTTGDGLLAEFKSIVDAVRCAVALQQAMAERNADVPAERRIEFRMGINLGDIIADDNDIYGDGVNIAFRLEGLAEPGGICVSAVVHDQVRGKLDFPFADIGEQQVKNIARPVRVYRVALFGGPGATPLPAPPALPEKPSIAVLPFANMSGDPEQEYFADGMVEEIITAFSRIRWLFVIARNSSFVYKGQAVDVRRVGRELGVRYVLEGSVRKAGGRVRIVVQLIDAENGAHLWAGRFEGALEDVFALQDEVAARVAGVIEPALEAAETARSVARSTTNLSAYDAYLRAMAIYHSNQQIAHALALMEQAIARDPRYAAALAWAALCCVRLVWDGSSEDPQAHLCKGADYSRRALQIAGDDPTVLANAAFALTQLGEDVGAMIALADRALAFNPSFARGWYVSSSLRLFAGDTDRAIEHAQAALRLSPLGRIGGVYKLIGGAHFFRRRFDDALPQLLLAVQDEPNNALAHRLLAACYAHMGRLDEARESITRLRASARLVVPSVVNFRNPRHRKLYLSGLRLAAGELPEEGNGCSSAEADRPACGAP